MKSRKSPIQLTPQGVARLREKIAENKGDPMHKLFKGAVMLKGEPGERGEAPVKGVHYWTEDDKKEIINDLINVIDWSVFKGGPGESIKGDPGNDGEDGEDGMTPERGVHYFTEEDKQSLITEVIDKLTIKEASEETEEPTAQVDSKPNLVNEAFVKEIIKVMKKLPEVDRIEVQDIRNAQSFLYGGRNIPTKEYKIEELMRGGGGTGGSSGTQVWGEVPTGSGTTFTLAHAPTAGTLRLYRGGSRQLIGVGNDYTLSGVTITFFASVSAGENLQADYSY